MKTKTKRIIFSILFPYLFLMIALVIPTDFSVTSPYDTRSTTDMVYIDDHVMQSNLHSVSVLSSDKITAFGRMLYELDQRVTVDPLSPLIKQLTRQEQVTRSLNQKQAAFEQAIVTAYTLAKEVDDQIVLDYTFIGMLIDYRESKHNGLKIGDVIKEIDQQTFTSYQVMANYFTSKNTLDLTVLRSGNEIDIRLDKLPTDRFAAYAKYEINRAVPTYKLPGQNVLSGGPSGGMMYTLNLYFSLLNYDKINEVIAGTGTIRHDAKIGEIGGLKQKVYVSIEKNIKYFILPKSQYNEVSHLADQIEIFQVETIEEAIRIIYEIFE